MRATLILILAIVLAYFYEASSLSSDFITSNLAFSTSNLLAGKPWTLVTALFVHASLVHLFGNMLFLFIFGAALESEVGGARMVGLFFFGGILTFLLGIPLYPVGTPLVGASAAIFTLSAAIMLIHPTKLTIIILPVGLVAVLFFLENVYAAIAGFGGNIAYYSHVIGFLVGIPFGIIWSKNPLRNLGITLLMLAVFLLIIYFVLPLFLPKI